MTHGPRCTECLKRERTFSLERVEHYYLMLTGVNDDYRVNVFDPINRSEIDENDGVVTVTQDCTQFVERDRVFGSSRKSKLSSDINHHQGFGAVRRAIASLAQFTFGYVNT